MKTLIFLGILIFIYYQLFKHYPEKFKNEHHIYFGIFVSGYLMLYYLMTFQKNFVYTVFKNIKDIDEKSLYDFNSITYKENQMNGMKYNLAMKQGWRCLQCQNPILQKDIHNHSVTYITPLQFGGKNSIHNMGIKCDRCTSFSPY
tara:strand:+ start:1152 stop:1586 length:435 start_codon:yes stop_codon:yes gene_type:complete